MSNLLFQDDHSPYTFYGAKARTLLSTHAATLRVFERKVLRNLRIFDSEEVDNNLLNRFSNELSSSQTWTLSSVLTTSSRACSTLSIYRMNWSGQSSLVEVSEYENLIYVGRTKLRKSCHRLTHK